MFIGSAQAQYIVTNGADNGAGTLRLAIAAGNASGTAYTISLQTSGPISLTSTLPDITQSCTITGATSLTPATATGGSIIQRSSETGVPEFRIFKAATSGKNFTLTDIILENGVGNEGDNNRGGGGLLTDNGVVLTMLRCLVRNCIVPVNRLGGGVHVVNGMGSFIDCEFQNNGNSSATGTQGGGVRIGPDASGNPGNVTFLRCTFTGNSAERGGDVYNRGPVVFTNCTFDANNGNGNRIYGYNGNVDIIGCTFQNGDFFSFFSQFQIINSLFVNPKFNGGNTSSLGGNVTNSISGNNGNVFNQSSDKNNQTIVLSTLQQNPGGLIRTFAIDASSPAVNAGLGSTTQPGITLPTSDANSQPRQCNPDAGAFEVQTVSIAITQQPASSSSVCQGTAVSISVSASGVVSSYQLYQDNVALGTAQPNPVFNITTAELGQFSYRVVITGCNSVTSDAFSLTVNTLPTAYTVTGGGAYCTGGAGVAVGLSGSQQGVNYQLLRGGISVRTVAGTGSAITFGNQTTVGTYTVQATTTTGSCQQAMSGSATVSITQLPNAGLTNNGPITCASPTVSLSATGGGTYSFSPGASQVSGGNTATVTQQGVYSVTVTTNGCSATATTTVTSNTLAPQNVTLSSSGTLTCTNTSVILTAGSSTTSVTYSFSGPGVTGSGSNMATANQQGTYTVKVTGTNGCTAIKTTNVESNTLTPTASLTNNGPISDNNQTVTLTAGGGTTYAFSPGASQQGGGIRPR